MELAGGEDIGVDAQVVEQPVEEEAAGIGRAGSVRGTAAATQLQPGAAVKALRAMRGRGLGFTVPVDRVGVAAATEREMIPGVGGERRGETCARPAQFSGSEL